MCGECDDKGTDINTVKTFMFEKIVTYIQSYTPVIIATSSVLTNRNHITSETVNALMYDPNKVDLPPRYEN